MNILSIEQHEGQVELLAGALAILLAFAGIVLSGSAAVYSDTVSGSVPHGLQRSVTHLVFGLAVMLVALYPDYRMLANRYILWALLATTILLLAAALFGPEIKGTHRWLDLFGLRIQPSELAKPVVVVAVAATLARAGDRVRTLDGLARPLIIAATIAGLVLVGKDLGTPTLLFLTTLSLVYAAGARWLHLLGLFAAGLPLFWLFANAEPYRLERLSGFTQSLGFSMETLEQIPWQLRQSIIAIGSGGIFGKGFGASSQKALFLPEPDNDFVFAIIAEELGLVSALAVLVAFLVIAWRGVAIARRASDPFGGLVALGATVMLTGQALCHMGVVTGILPTKGLPLPFVSSGGSSLVSSFALIGLLLNVSLRRRTHVETHGEVIG